MTDTNKPVHRRLHAAREHLRHPRARRESIQALVANYEANQPQNAAQPPLAPPMEGTPA